MRVLPVESTVEKMQSIQTYHQMKKMIKTEATVAVAPCLCRQSAQLKGEPCARPLEMCLSFGDYAQFYIDNGVARQLTHSELLELLKVAEESNWSSLP